MRVCVKFGGPPLFFGAAAAPWVVVVVVSRSKVGVRDPGLERGVEVCVGWSEWAYCLLGLVVVVVVVRVSCSFEGWFSVFLSSDKF